VSVSLWLLIFALAAENAIYGCRNQKLEMCERSRLRTHILIILAPEQFGVRRELPIENTAYRLRNVFFLIFQTEKTYWSTSYNFDKAFD